MPRNLDEIVRNLLQLAREIEINESKKCSMRKKTFCTEPKRTAKAGQKPLVLVTSPTGQQIKAPFHINELLEFPFA